MSDKSALRALPPLRLFMFAAVLSLAWIIAGALSASADDGLLGQPVLSGTAPAAIAASDPVPTVIIPVAVADRVKPVTEPVAAVTNPVAAVANRVAPVTNPVAADVNRVAPVANPVAAEVNRVAPVANPVAAEVNRVVPVTNPVAAEVNRIATVTNPVAAVVNPVATALAPVVASVEPISPVTDLASSRVVVDDQLPLAAPGSARSHAPIAHVLNVTLSNRPAVTNIYIARPPMAVVSPAFSYVPNAASDSAFATSSLLRSSPQGPPASPFTAPSAATSGASGSGTGGHDSGAAALPFGAYTLAALLLARLPQDPWVLAASLANDPGSSPD